MERLIELSPALCEMDQAGPSSTSDEPIVSRLPKDLSGLMGQANLSFAKGDKEDAIYMCQEVIRLAPNCPDPFISLAEHFEDEGDEEKAEQLYLVAAYLEPSNVNSWLKVADFATERKEYKLAATCYTKAIRAEPSIHAHLKRCIIYEKLGDKQRALRGYESLIGTDEKLGLELARNIARIYMKDEKIEQAIRALETAVLKYPNQLKNEDIEQLSHLYNLNQNYNKTIEFITSHKSNLKLTLKTRCYMLVALISSGFEDDRIEDLENMVSNISDSELIEYRDCFYDIAKAYFSQKLFVKSKEILYKLTRKRDSQVASIWLLYSQCLKNLDEIDEAIIGYKKVIALKPNDFSSRLALSNLLTVQNRIDEAIEITKQPLFLEPIDIPLLYQSCQLLKQTRNWLEYYDNAKALLLTDMSYIQHPREIFCMITSKSWKTRVENLRALHRDLNLEPCLKQRYIEDNHRLDPTTLLDIFLLCLRILYHVKKDFQELKRICFSAYTGSNFECHESQVDFFSVMACICTNDSEFTYSHMKVLVSRNTDNNQAWNLFNLAMCNIYKDLRHTRFCIRLTSKNPDTIPLALINGHNALMSGSYKHALKEYMAIFGSKPNDPMIAFYIALTFLSLSCQRYVSSKYLCLFQMIAFVQVYLELRGTCQETIYNIGRIFHQINMVDKAVYFYKKVLCMNDEQIEEDQDGIERGIYSLKREAAFNLALIYKNSQSYRLAYQVIKNNLTV